MMRTHAFNSTHLKFINRYFSVEANFTGNFFHFRVFSSFLRRKKDKILSDSRKRSINFLKNALKITVEVNFTSNFFHFFEYLINALFAIFLLKMVKILSDSRKRSINSPMLCLFFFFSQIY